MEARASMALAALLLAACSSAPDQALFSPSSPDPVETSLPAEAGGLPGAPSEAGSGGGPQGSGGAPETNPGEDAGQGGAGSGGTPQGTGGTLQGTGGTPQGTGGAPQADADSGGSAATGGAPGTGGGPPYVCGDPTSSPPMKICNGQCVSPSPANGCGSLDCQPCPAPPPNGFSRCVWPSGYCGFGCLSGGCT